MLKVPDVPDDREAALAHRLHHVGSLARSILNETFHTLTDSAYRSLSLLGCLIDVALQLICGAVHLGVRLASGVLCTPHCLSAEWYVTLFVSDMTPCHDTMICHRLRRILERPPQNWF